EGRRGPQSAGGVRGEEVDGEGRDGAAECEHLVHPGNRGRPSCGGEGIQAGGEEDAGQGVAAHAAAGSTDRGGAIKFEVRSSKYERLADVRRFVLQTSYFVP